MPACDRDPPSCMIPTGQTTILVARDAALRRPCTNMVTERSASPAWGEQPSILARLREWSAQHPLRPADGSPPTLCSASEIPILWAQPPSPDDPYRPSWFLARRAE